MTDTYIESVSERYIELYENILGEKFVKANIDNIDERIEKNVVEYLASKKQLFYLVLQKLSVRQA